MNREHAEHLLHAYVRMRMSEFDPDASDALREVILDAMTEYKATTYPGITYPKITLPSDNKPWVTFTGIDPSYSTCTTGVSE